MTEMEHLLKILDDSIIKVEEQCGPGANPMIFAVALRNMIENAILSKKLEKSEDND